MAEEYNTVPVEIQNLSEVKIPAERIANTSSNIYSLLNGREFKDKLSEVAKSSNTTNVRLESLRTLLSGVSKSVANIEKSISSKSTDRPESEKDSTSFRKDTKDSINKLVDSNREILDTLKDLVKNLPDIELHCSCDCSDSTGLSPSEQEAQRREDAKDERALNKTDEMIRLLNLIAKQDRTTGSEEQSKKQERIHVEKSDEENKSQVTARENAINALNNKASVQSRLLSEISDIGKKFFSVFTKSVSDIFNRWDNQTRLLKEQGMGSSNAVQLNRMTRRTMDATEDLLGYNISVEKAIRATHDMMAAGMNPRYIRENNKQFITGLEAVGIQLAPSTIREIGNSVFDATNVRELTGGWAQLTSSDTENALDKGFVGRQLGSDEYKQMMATIMRTGEYSRSDIDRAMQEALRRSIQQGWSNEDAWSIAQAETQARLGGGAITVVPKNIQSLIGAAQLAGTFTDVAHLSEGMAGTVQAYQSNAEVRRRINQASAGLANAGDFTLFSNIQMNEGRTRRLASMEDIRAGQSEGFIPRIGKAVAGILPAESISGASQSLTGDSSFFTQMAGGLFGKVGSFLGESVQTGLLMKIERNTNPDSSGMSGLLEGLFGSKKPGVTGVVGGTLGKLLPITGAVVGTAATVGMIYNSVNEYTSSKEQAEEMRKAINESIKNEESLRSQLREARLSGDVRKVEEIKRILDESQKRTDQQIDMLESATDREDVSLARGIASGVGGIGGMVGGGLLGGGLLGAKLGALAGPVGIVIGGILGAGLGFIGSELIGGLATSDTESELEEKRIRARYLARHGRLNEYANGGIITEEEVARLGENNNPEVVIPLTNADKAKELMSQASQVNGVDPNVSDMMSKAVDENAEVKTDQRTVADLIIANAKSLIGVPYQSNHGYDDNPQRGVVCNQLVEYAYHKAGIPLKSRSVHYHVQSGDWALTETPQPGFAIFSNYGPKAKYNGLSDWGHLGIVGYGNERIHASSKAGRVVYDSDLTRTLKYEENKKKYARRYVFGYLKGVDYGNGTDLPEPTVIAQTTGRVVSDVGSENNIVDTPSAFIPSKKDVDRSKYNLFLNQYTPDSSVLNNEVIGDILLAKKQDTTDSFYDMLASNNPLGLKDTDGTIKEFNTLQEGVEAFISKMEVMHEHLKDMDYMQQLAYYRDTNMITPTEYQRAKGNYDERLYEAIERLRQSIDQSNMYSRANYNRNLPTQPFQGRRYV